MGSNLQRSVIIPMSEALRARSLSTLFPLERRNDLDDITVALVALVQQLESINLLLMAALAPEDS